MGSRYPERDKSLNMTQTINARLLHSQVKNLKEHCEKFNMTQSEIVREALSVWFNNNPIKGGK